MKSSTSTISRRETSISRRVVQGDHARNALRAGIATMANLLGPTLGPTAGMTAISGITSISAPEILDSAGVIARRTVAIEGQYQNMGAMLLRQLVWNMHDNVGDGGATAAVVSAHLLDSASRYVDAGGDTTAVIRGVKAAAKMVTDALTSQSHRIELPGEIAQVVESSLGHAGTAQMIGEALEATGADGALFLRDAPAGLTECEYAAGAIWDSGPLSSYLMNGAHVAIQNPCILVCDFELAPEDVLPVLESCVASGQRSLLIIAPGLQSRAAGLLVANRDNGNVPSLLAMKPPSSHGAGKQSLEEIALITGARLFSKIQGNTLRNLQQHDFGQARQVWATNATMGIIGGKGSITAIQTRLREVRQELAQADNDDTRDTIRKRIGRLASLTVTLRAGGRTERERDAFRERMRSAMAAGRAAMTSGVVPGGGVALLAASRAIDLSSLSGDEVVGARLLARALEEPFRTISANAGFHAPVDTREIETGMTFDVISRKWVDPWEAGIVDPLRLPQQVVAMSTSFVATILRTDTLVHKAQPDISLNP